MKHYGDITKINGANVPPVNVIIGGSPCQDLSIAGKRAGLAGERSGLFMAQIRVIKEMRKADENRGRTGTAIRPRYMVWENVPGAFSSNRGADFGAVLQETVRVVCEKVPDVPMPANGWPTAGCLVSMEGDWSVAWRVLDAQFWGVPQRRRRIALVADFGGVTAPEILFERAGVSGYYPQGKTPWKSSAGAAACGARKTGAGELVCMATQQGGAEIRTDDCAPTLTAAAGMSGNNQPVIAKTLKIRCGCNGGGKGALVQDEKSATLSCNNDQTLFQPTYCIQGNCVDRADTAVCNGKGWTEGVSYTLNTIDRPAVVSGFKANMGSKAGGIGYEEGKAPTLSAGQHDASIVAPVAVFENHGQDTRFNGPVDVSQTVSSTFGTGGNNTPFVVQGGAVGFVQAAYDKYAQDDTAATVKAKGGNYGGGSENLIVEGFDGYNATLTGEKSATLGVNCGMSTGRNGVCATSINGEIAGTLDASYHKGCGMQGGIERDVVLSAPKDYLVRRLTPLECERLQGFPDGWTDIGDWIDSNGKKHKDSDSPRYKALGNSIAIPPWFYILQKLSLCCGDDITMASLFDGIGGFPLVWETPNGKGTCLWASEIEEFPIAVTKLRFAEEETK